ncbi:MAG: choice-of-anchor tandem repeat GloVer-containing protein [Terriglobales bacterium]
MYLVMNNRRAKSPCSISNAGPRRGSTRLATAIIRSALTLAAIAVLVLMAVRPAQAQPETVLYSFCSQPNCSDGAYPQSSLIFDAAGNLYGTTNSGGLWGYGTVFELSPNGNGGWNETVLYSFTGGADGANPTYSSVMFDSVGNLYGTGYGGGANGYGVVFELSPAGASWTETVLYSFANTPDGANPVNGLIMDPAGNLYGKTFNGGQGNGVVFQLSPSGFGADWTEQVIYVPETQASNAGLTMDAAGNIFGTTYSTVFEMSPNGDGGWNPNVIHTFCSGKDGCDAEGTLALDQAGNLYGTTVNGGLTWGTVYKLSPGEHGWTEKLIHEFFANGGGVWPFAGIALDTAGNIYGTAVGQWPGGGFIYELTPIVGTSKYTPHELWKFNGWDGSCYFGNVLLASGGVLYGTTPNGGSTFWHPPHFPGYGVVFELKVATKTTLTSSPNPSTYGEAVTFTATVTSKLGPPPDGETVSFMKGKTVLGTGTLSGGSATFITSTLKVGTTSVKAVYGGDSTLAGSKSNAVRQVVENAGK